MGCLIDAYTCICTFTAGTSRCAVQALQIPHSCRVAPDHEQEPDLVLRLVHLAGCAARGLAAARAQMESSKALRSAACAKAACAHGPAMLVRAAAAVTGGTGGMDVTAARMSALTAVSSPSAGCPAEGYQSLNCAPVGLIENALLGLQGWLDRLFCPLLSGRRCRAGRAKASTARHRRGESEPICQVVQGPYKSAHAGRRTAGTRQRP